ncbi:glycosyltransferase family 39 protein [Nocardioides sp. CER19]|uniref:glycosyltransferase family 39 protein n=1 Tax=Nocardioides sp. CER19 TaxID=3038538 RepID=UPI002446DAF1|nr:glycosyltransferase family 39 protein [Nocardioides sp. CER19]MDH2415138.1 glycosyltransferase family 39 protein [Nocardioides sp. CER19]
MRRREVTTRAGGYPVPIRTALRLPLISTVVLALGTAVLRLPYLHRPLSPDEGGFLLLAGQWSPGSSVYGDYWVDRPPLLIGIFELAGWLGGGAGLRALGMVAVAVSVVLAGVIGRLAAPGRRWAATLTAATAAVFLSTPLFGTREVNGEMLAVPFVLAGLVAVLHAVTTESRATGWWAGAGILAVCAVAVKQNMADVVVAGAVALMWQARARGLRRTAYDALAAVAGGVAALVAFLAWAEARGTEPRALWDAAVSFRFEAASVISTDDPHNTTDRLRGLVRAFRLSGAPLLLLLPLLPFPRARERGCLPFVAAAVLLWEMVGVAGGGSYWWHYLIGLVPGLVLLVAALARHRPGLQVPVVAVLALAVVMAVHTAVFHPGPSREARENEAAGAYLAAHARPGDTGVVAFGVPSILQRAGLESPYRYLWSLPVRVRDPELTELTRVLESRDRPDWVVVAGDTLETWGVDPARAQQVLNTRYRADVTIGRWHLFHVMTGRGTLSG